MTAREEKVKQRIRTGHAKVVKRLLDAQAADLNEADTSALVAHILQTLLGYDPLDDLTQQYKVRGLFADYGVKIDGQLVAFVEVKSARTALNERHLRQVEQYATRQGLDWLILTNAIRWQVYHVTFTKPITRDLVIDVDLTTSPAAQLVDELYRLTKESLKRRELERVWKERTAVGPSNLLKVMFSAPVLDRIRKELRAITGINPSPEDCAASIRELLAPKVLEEMETLLVAPGPKPARRGRGTETAERAGSVESGEN
ncbi:MAG: type I restriction enzyme HsdR N-terminal domain-containing protein [Dehalococcoidia bacterium]|nr:type I restriction enzyme HsdR N-terminal domain-containing protein [Dehalococcoidia bacterium]